MPPRGLKALLKRTAPAKLTGRGKRKGYVLLEHGKPTKKLRGVTRVLEKTFWSGGELQSVSKTSTTRKFGWQGKNGGLRRGTRVDAQLERLINGGPKAAKSQRHIYKLTGIVLAALQRRGLEPVYAQRTVCAARKRLGTAVDLIAYQDETLVLVELKCGYDQGRTAPALVDGQAASMRAPLTKCADCVLHRHFLQLAVTLQLFLNETATQEALATHASAVQGLLMYANDEGVDFYDLPEWWRKRGTRLLKHL
tara:strand:- start:2608 stop:3363 length:756 start_codon:yes stop_codon:yes gene_type:complete